MDAAAGQYPVRLQIDLSERGNRLTTLFRLLLGIPHILVLYAIGLAAEILTILLWFVIVITGKRPEGLTGFLVYVLRWCTRVNAYLSLLTDEYPPFSGDERQYPARIQVDYSERGNRLTTFFRLLLTIPHFIALMVIGLVADIGTIVLWIVIIITGKRPDGLARFLVYYLRWSTRVNAYLSLLIDEYPPFNGDE